MDLMFTRPGFPPAARSTNIGGTRFVGVARPNLTKSLFPGGSANRQLGNDRFVGHLPIICCRKRLVRFLGISGVSSQEPERRDFL
jgi:hypothetical protein